MKETSGAAYLLELKTSLF